MCFFFIKLRIESAEMSLDATHLTVVYIFHLRVEISSLSPAALGSTLLYLALEYLLGREFCGISCSS